MTDLDCMFSVVAFLFNAGMIVNPQSEYQPLVQCTSKHLFACYSALENLMAEKKGGMLRDRLLDLK
jgi:hypothetical protein